MKSTAQIIIALLLITAIFVLAIFKSKGTAPSRYIARRLMTENETEFFHRLMSALPEFYVFPQVAMSALIEHTSTGKAAIRDRNRIDRKVVDFCIFDVELKLICVVELDDSTHKVKKDEARDKITGSAGIRTLRWKSKNKPDVIEIRNEVLKAEIVALP